MADFDTWHALYSAFFFWLSASGVMCLGLRCCPGSMNAKSSGAPHERWNISGCCDYFSAGFSKCRSQFLVSKAFVLLAEDYRVDQAVIAEEKRKCQNIPMISGLLQSTLKYLFHVKVTCINLKIHDGSHSGKAPNLWFV